VDSTASRWWAPEEALLGLTRDPAEGNFAKGGLVALAVNPTVRIVVLPGNPSCQVVPPVEPLQVMPKVITLPDGQQLPYHGAVRGTSSGYVGYTAGDGARWQSFDAVHWHGGVDVFLGPEGGRKWESPAGFTGRVIFLRKTLGWAWPAFDLQRHVVARFGISGPFRVIVAVADTAGAVLGMLGAGWAEPTPAALPDLPTAIERRVLVLEDLAEWPDENGTIELVLRFGAGLDLAFGGPGERHLDRVGPEQGRFKPEVVTRTAGGAPGPRPW
jgi:hypothetical protein